ncbi:cAMP-regulated phosphoprotein/endosulfine region [Ostertagia ostertagi]
MRSEMGSEVPEDLEEGLSVEKQQEQQLMNKLASQGRLPARPASSFLQKKLQQRKFFDSGDYAMDKDRSRQVAPVVWWSPSSSDGCSNGFILSLSSP